MPALFPDSELSRMTQEQREDDNRLEAERVTAEWRTRNSRTLPDLSNLPLFGGPRQGSMFDQES